MSNIKVRANDVSERSTRLLNIGRAWVNNVPDGSRGPVISGQIDRNLGADVTLAANDRILFFPNKKREGIRDADFRLAIEVPSGVAQEIIERQRGNIR